MRRPTSCQLALLLLFLNLCRGQGSDSGDGRSDSGDGRSSCHRCDSHLSCNCSHGGFTHIPVVTDRALTIDLSCNAIATVMDDDLMGHTRLRALDLHGNGLAAIQPSAFDSLWSLEELDLSDNQLAALNYRWFRKLEALQQLNLLSNPYSCLGSPPLFQGLIQLRRLAFGGPALEELRRGDLSGVTQLEELTVHANNLTRYESGTLADIWPLGRVTLSLHGPFLTNMPVASAVLGDVSYPETPITLEDLHLIGNWSVQPLRESARKRIRHLSFRNLSVSDEAVVSLLVVVDGVPITYLSVDGITLTGEGRWEKASYTDQRSIDEFFAQDVVVLDVFKFFSLLDLKFLLQYLRRVSVINSKVFVMPCITSKLLVNLQYLDLSDNLLTDLTLVETLCGDHETLKELRVLNISGNPLKSLSTVSRLVTKLSKLTHLDVSRTGYISMPPSCPWPSTLRHLNISGAKLTTTTPCLPATLEVLDLSNNNLRGFTQHLPVLRELHLSGNKFLSLPPGQLFPNLQTLTIHGEPVGRVHLSIVTCHRVLFVSVSCGLVLVVGVLLGVFLWRLHAFWYLKMTWAWLKAKHSSRCRQRHRVIEGSEALLSFDAFVSYSERDAGWVENFLVPELEEPSESDSGDPRTLRSLTLCLHKRDFLPGHWIVDNIMSAMERSRRTVFILSENFVQSDWCRYELDFSHFWLFDGHAGGEAAILVLLEPLSKDDVPKRFYKLRKLMSSTTYLEWPREEERRPEFWRSLRKALRGGDEDD
ncbi:toll-like receptor 2 isoform X2 [Amphiprion ocellaris]|uniref:toll-like receptor 2 isoform X2 n=1 Tax=Amphiprion ocellaris TaxID=80972 RepID=UPI0024112807|nr:toll-like receptor 2 isoform X2 [Amphiprion ocellaris]